MKILLAEDEKRMNRALTEIMRQEGYEVTSVENGEDALLEIEGMVYDLIVLDVMMPKMNGFAVAKKVRAEGIRTPILMLTAKAELDDKVEGLDSGADDYLTKPFMTKELLARLRALARRNLPTDDGSLKYEDLTLDVKKAVLSCENGQSIRLGEKELRILEYLIVNQGQVLSREQIALKIWGYESDSEYNNVEVYMSFARKKLAFVGSKCEIKALRGLGYELRCKDV
ncbi:MAG: response regulator transcription factor [Lachnospiraceae bacterium]|nr:response regulator transcription factor [Lachnospiraceae bacterium]